MLTVSELACSRGPRTLFHDVSFTVAPGQWLHVQGDNGVGKTTLLRAVCGLGTRDQGQVQWKHDQPQAANLTYLGHQLGLKDDLSPLENLRFDGALHARSGEAQGKAALRRLGLGAHLNTPVKRLSQGQKRRCALARLLTSAAPLWVLDEPFVALDDAATETLTQVLNEHLAQQGAILLSSHQAVHLNAPGRGYRLSA